MNRNRMMGSRADTRTLRQMLASKAQWGLYLWGMLAMGMVVQDWWRNFLWAFYA